MTKSNTDIIFKSRPTEYQKGQFWHFHYSFRCSACWHWVSRINITTITSRSKHHLFTFCATTTNIQFKILLARTLKWYCPCAWKFHAVFILARIARTNLVIIFWNKRSKKISNWVYFGIYTASRIIHSEINTFQTYLWLLLWQRYIISECKSF